MATTSKRLTPYDDDYPTCERTAAKLLIYTEEIEPDEISDRLGISPTRMVKKGAKSVNSLGRERTAPCSYWMLDSESSVESKDLRVHLDWILDQCTGREQALEELREVNRIRDVISCVWWSAHGHGGPTLWPRQMEAMARLNLECGFDIYFFGDNIIDEIADVVGGNTQ